MLILIARGWINPSAFKKLFPGGGEEKEKKKNIFFRVRGGAGGADR